MTPGYCDSIAHALAFAAKHGVRPLPRGRAPTWPTRPANVAVILARHGADEPTIVAGVLCPVLNESSPARRQDLHAKVRGKFGETVDVVLRQAVEPRYDARGKERTWEAYKLDHLASLALAEPRALEAAAAQEIYQCGALITDVRRLGAEYLSGYAQGGGAAVVRWFHEMVDALERHPTGPRPGMIVELRHLAGNLGALLERG
ncbi:MAG TPA: hypothetical protein VMG41_00720 [Gemmatimonadales bacterium]|nr:hypothetical protein [Gemmatimonadales bacterium]